MLLVLLKLQSTQHIKEIGDFTEICKEIKLSISIDFIVFIADMKFMHFKPKY